MENVVKYICMNYDYQHARQNRFPDTIMCTYTRGLPCIGISGYMLNYYLSFFLSYNLCLDEKAGYKIKWVCDSSVLFPAVVRQSNGRECRYIGTLPNQSGALNVKPLEREQCEHMPYTCLKLVSCKQDMEQEIVNLGALLQEQFRLSPNDYSSARRMALMSVGRIVRTGGTDKETVSSAKNCLLLFFAPDTIKSLHDFAMRTTDTEELSLLLDFLSRYCAFISELVEKCKSNPVNIHIFAEHFEKCWNINIRRLLDEMVHPSIKSYEYKSALHTDKDAGSQLMTILQDCVEAGTYEQRTRPMRNIYLHIQEHCTAPDAENRLKNVDKYLCTMQEMRKQKGRRRSR